MSSDLLRMSLIMMPGLLLAHQFVHREHPVMRWVGALFAHIWQFQWRLILFAMGIHFGLWEFSTDDMLLLRVPSDIILGCGLLLGVVPRIITPRMPLTLILSLDVVLCLFLLPLEYAWRSIPFLLTLSVVVILPSHWLARWTEQDNHLYARSILQNIGWAILLLWLFPSVVFNLTNDSWQPLLQRPLWQNLVLLIPMLLPSVLLLNALYEFAKQGRGTAFPYDAPKFLVTTGIYRYLSNPMQTGIVLMMLLWGGILESGLIMLSAPVALVLFLVFKNVCNGSCRIGVCDPDWQRYQDTVPKWLPKWTSRVRL